MLHDAQLSLYRVVESVTCYMMLNYHSSCEVIHVLHDGGVPMPGMMWYFSLTHLSTAVVTIFTLG